MGRMSASSSRLLGMNPARWARAVLSALSSRVQGVVSTSALRVIATQLPASAPRACPPCLTDQRRRKNRPTPLHGNGKNARKQKIRNRYKPPSSFGDRFGAEAPVQERDYNPQQLFFLVLEEMLGVRHLDLRRA